MAPCRHLAARLLLLLGLLAAAGCTEGDHADTPLPTESLTVNGTPLTAELALTPDARFRGLSGRAHLAPDRGMLFVFPKEQRLQFVMRDCLIPIDIAFIDAAGRVLSVHQMTLEPPDTPERNLPRYGSDKPAMFALELAAGGLERYGLTPGVELDLPVLSLRRRAE